MRKALLLALALSTASIAAVPAFAHDRDRDDRMVREHPWSPEVTVRHGRHGYWDERHHWREVHFANHHGHRGYWDYRHHWHEWNG